MRFIPLDEAGGSATLKFVPLEPKQPEVYKRGLVVNGELYDFNGQESFDRAKSLTNPSLDDIKMLGGRLVPRPPVSVDQIPKDPARPAAPVASAPAPSGVPGPRAGSTASAMGRSLASAADLTVGQVAPFLTELVNYPIARTLAGKSDTEARDIARQRGDVTRDPFGRMAGVKNTPEYQQEGLRQILESDAAKFVGQNIDKSVDWLSQNSGLPKQDVVFLVDALTVAVPGKKVAKALPEAAARAIDPTVGPTPGLPAQVRKAETASVADFKESGRIEAAQIGKRYGLAMPPAQSNPTVGNKARGVLKGENTTEANAALTAQNVAKIDEIMRYDTGIPTNVALTSKDPFVAARAKHEGPYNQIGQMGTLAFDNVLGAALKKLEVSPSVTEKAAAYNGRLDTLRDLVQTGNFDGATALRDIRNLRDASAGAWKAGDTLEAKFARGMADAIEGVVERNMKNPREIQKFKDARKQMAKIYAWEDTVDFNTGKIDPTQIAKVTGSESGKFTGALNDVGKFAGNFPSAVSTSQGLAGQARLARSGLGGMAGFGIGSMAGMGFEGSLVGAALGEVVGAAGRRGVLSEAAQRRAVPPDRRIQPEAPPFSPFTPAAGPVSAYNPNVVGPNFMLNPGGVPLNPQFAPSNQLAIGMRNGPNFTMPQRPAPSPIPPNAPNPMTAARTALTNEPYSPATGERLRQQQYDIDRRAAEAAAAAAEGQRAPTKGGVELSLDPFMGKLRPVKQAGEALPPTNELTSAVSKMESGQSFAMTATEKVAWKKAQSNLKLATDATYASKFTPEDLSNRQWLMDTVTKTRQKADAFDEIAKRATQAEAARVPGAKVPSAAEIATAKANRDRMLDFAEDLQTRLSALPKQKLGQGPKTRNALRDGRSNSN